MYRETESLPASNNREKTILDGLEQQVEILEQSISDVLSALNLPAYAPQPPTTSPVAVPMTPLHALRDSISHQCDRLFDLRNMLRS